MIAALLALLCAAGQETRTPWTTSRVHGSPDAPPPYRSEPSFPKLRLRESVDAVAVPGSNRLAVAELFGRVVAFENRGDINQADVLLDEEAFLLGIAMHPRFAQNGFFYVAIVPRQSPWVELTRYTVVNGRAARESAMVLLRWPFKKLFSLLGGALRFGPDGYLYVGIGDGKDGDGGRPTGQDLGDLESSILRIDVDRPPPGRRYAIPRDNPFVGVRGARPEVWAFGFRQPWKMSFDPQTGDLWVGDVGGMRWESILRVRRGGNYGWSVKEGEAPAHPGRPSDLSPISPPVAVHPHTELRAIMGGIVYRGNRFPELAGSYIYGDYDTGRVWELRLDGEKVIRHRELAVTALRIIGFVEDEHRELHVLNFKDGTLHHLEPNTGAVRNVDFPRTLSATGLFASVRDHRPADGVVPYAINAALWSDGADKDRFIALPGTSRLRPDVIRNEYVTAPGSETWDFPDGTVLVKTFSIAGRRIETRLLHLKKKAATGDIQDQEWRGYSYQWNEEQTEADLVDAAGRTVEVSSGARKQSWRYPSRSECIQCHSMAAHFVLGVTTPQLNREVDVPGRGRVNQLEWLDQLGLIHGPLRRPPPRRLGNYEEKSEDAGLRARSYLHANCAHCHVFLGGGNASFKTHAALSLEETGLVDVPPIHGSLGLPDARLIAPGSPERSMIVHRMKQMESGRMPPLSSHVVDEEGVRVLSEWIRQLPPVRKTETRPWIWSGASVVLLAAGVFSARRFRRARTTEPRTGPPPTR